MAQHRRNLKDKGKRIKDETESSLSVWPGSDKGIFEGWGRSKTGSLSFLAELLRFDNSQNVEMVSDYFFSPSRRRSSLEEIAPSFFVRDRERSMIARNLRFVLRDN